VDGEGEEPLFREPPRFFGILAPGPTFVLALVLLVAGVALLLAASVVAGIVLLAFAGTAFVLFYGAAKRDPYSPVARRITASGRNVRGGARFARESSAAWLRASQDVARLAKESRALRRERKRILYELGDAAYREDAALTGALRLRLREIDEGLASRAEARATAVASARSRIHDERVAVEPTRSFSVNDLSSGGREQG
jgi:hypothetical protein